MEQQELHKSAADYLKEDGLIVNNDAVAQTQVEPTTTETQEQEPSAPVEPQELKPSGNIIELDGNLNPVQRESDSEVVSDPVSQDEQLDGVSRPMGSNLLDFLNGRFEGLEEGEQLKVIQEALDNQSSIEEIREELEITQNLTTQMRTALEGQDTEMLEAMQFKKETGINDLNVYTDLKTKELSSMSPEEAIRLAKRIQSPGVAQDDLNFLIANKYKQDTEKYDEDEVRLGKIQLQEDSYQAVKYLNDLKSKINVPETVFDIDAKQQELHEELKVRKENWEGIVTKAFEVPSKPVFKIKDNVSLEFDVDPKLIEEYKKDALEYAVQNKLDFTEEAYEELNLYTRNRYILSNYEKMLHSAYERGANDIRKQTDQELHNPSALNSDKIVQDGPTHVDVSDELASMTMKKFGF